MSENENEYQPYAAGLPVTEETVVEAVDFEEPAPAVEPEMNRSLHGAQMDEAYAEPTVEPTPEPEPEPAPTLKRKTENVTAPAANHVVGDGDHDEVYLKQCVYKNMYARKSLTVHHLQRRLGELGYGDATADRDGWYGDLTLGSVKAFQEDNKLEPTGIMDAVTFERVFAGDPNVKVVTSQE